MNLLSVRGLQKSFGALKVVDSIDLDVREGEILGVVGPNGAGKTTLFNLITGFLPASSGAVEFARQDVTHMAANGRCNAGIARTFQTPQLFGNMTVGENVEAGGVAGRLGFWIGKSAARKTREQWRHKSDQLLEMVGLSDARNARAGDLSYGHQRKLEIARALMTGPRLLLLDEPAAGMTQPEARQIKKLIRQIQTSGCSVVVIDHNMRLIMNVCERIVVMNFGRVIADGDPANIRSNPAVISAYLGGG